MFYKKTARSVKLYCGDKQCYFSSNKIKDTIFTCTKCNCFTKDYNKMFIHQKICRGQLSCKKEREKEKEKKENLKNENKKLKEEIDILSKILKNKEENEKKMKQEIINLEYSLKIEKIIKNSLQILLNETTSLNSSKVIEELKDGIHIHGIRSKDIPFIFHSEDEILQINPNVNPNINPSLNEKKEEKKETFRAINKVEEKKEDIKLKIETVDEEVKEIVRSKFEFINIKDCENEINNVFVNIKEGRKYTKNLEYIKTIRCKMLGWMDIEEYKNMILQQIDHITNIFTEKSMEKKKITLIIFEHFTGLELRLARYKSYTKTCIDPEDIYRLKLSLEVCTPFPKEYKPFERSFERFKNYNLVLFTLEKCVECYLINRYGFNNLVYIDIKTKKENERFHSEAVHRAEQISQRGSIDKKSDFFGFYYLEKIEKGIRYWKMDSRLENISEEFSETLLPFCISLYKKIYIDIFGDNYYRPDISDMSPIANGEMEQLLENILILSNQDSCRDLLQRIIRTSATHSPTMNDKINLRVPDKTQIERFSEQRKEYNEDNVIYNLYNKITKKEVDEFILKFKST
jgi:hypothetical protein